MDIEKKPVFSKKNIIILVVGIIVLVTAGIIIFAQVKTSEKNLTESNNTSITPTVSPAYLYFSPPSIKLLQAKQNGITSDIVLDTQGKSISTVQMEVSFDPAIISNVRFSKTDDLSSPFSGFNTDQTVVDKTAGKAFIVLGVSNSDTAKSGKGKLATITYDVIGTSNKKNTIIEITPLTALVTKGLNVSFEKTNLEIIFP